VRRPRPYVAIIKRKGERMRWQTIYMDGVEWILNHRFFPIDSGMRENKRIKNREEILPIQTIVIFRYVKFNKNT